MMTARQRVETALLGQWADKVPFTAYCNKFFPSQVERELRNDGFCIVEHRVPAFTVHTPDVTWEAIHYRDDDGTLCIRNAYRLPQGTLTEMSKQLPEHPRIPGELLPWHKEYLFKGPDDYALLEFMIRNRRYEPTYEALRKAQEQAGDDAIFILPLGYSPLQVIINDLMGLERFAVEWHYRREEVLELYQALVEDHRKFYPLAAESPALAVDYCGNVASEIIGLDRFRKYLLPCYNELADLLHERGKLLGVHLDANNRGIASAIAESHIDYVEAFSPYPSTDMSVADARVAWPDKVLWINFPPTAFLEPPERVEAITRQILREAKPGNRFLIGITEAVPRDRWQATYAAIMRVLDTEGRLPLA